MIDNYIGKWKGVGMQLPKDFITERIIGELKVELPQPPDIDEILNYDLPIRKQKWTPTKIPSDSELLEMQKEERINFIRQEIDRRNNGIFFYNNGAIEYITGIHYFYLTYWKMIGAGTPQFRDSDRDFFYAWDCVCQDKDSFGLLYFTNRRDGKSEKSLNILYEYISKTEEVNGGIQSQTTDDAKKLFSRLVFSWRKMPYFWKPTDSGDKNPKKELRFEEPSVRSTKGDIKTYKRVLNSIIDYRASTESAYDGYALWRFYCDEFGKFEEGDAYNRWNVVKPTLSIGLTIRGKAIFTTTVEDLEKGGGQSALDMWKDSDVNNRKKDNRTKTGLYRLFKPAYYGLEGFVDEYGYSKISEAKKALMNSRDGLEGIQLIRETRKYPFSIKEVFQSSTISNVFPTFKIIQQKEYNEDNGIIPRIGNLIWDDKENFIVSFKDDPNGKFETMWMPEEKERNKFNRDRDVIKPLNTHLGAFGVDPFDHRNTVGDGSNGACLGFRVYDPINSKNSNAFFLKYLQRPPKETIFYDDMCKAFVFYGMEALIENQKPGLINYMLDNGFKHYVKRTQQGDYTKSNSRAWIDGVSMSGEIIREIAIGNLETYIYDFVGKISPDIQRNKFGVIEGDLRDDLYGNCGFSDLLTDWVSFDSNKWTKYDLTVASMLARLAVTPIRNKKNREETISILKKLSFPTFKM